ncbi:MAG: DEAD/DEAH box helicase [Succiniclasticum sp.]|jgi:ATP-dependent RNA helicase DeaD|nr:DEAD/DEAH box helicase [Succiniclasticum sp.]MEE3478511.1 DEAD/DEAH box helicase [Succiniclasticum sp.]
MTTQTENFGELVLEKRVVTALKDMGFEEPSPIQLQAVPLLLEGKDIIGQAQTGTGKTAAFGIPIVQGIEDHRHIQALILSPTRELAIQVAEEIGNIGRTKHIRAVPVYGGQPIERQIRALKSGVQIVIGTPGRLLDHIHRGTIKLDHVRYLVLDEADEMLDMGFIDDIEEILGHIPTERQTMLFSATMPRPILSLTKRYMRAPQMVTVSKEEITVPLIEQYYFETRDKVEGISRLLDAGIDGKMIIFCRTKRGVDDLVAALGSRGYIAEGLHGDLTQTQRDRVMKKFREGRLDILIATDVAARGLDIDNVQYVINYDIPQDPESYVHRIGRTGRAGNTGVALTFILPREFRQLKLIERVARTRIRRRELPTTTDVLEHQREQIISKMQSLLEIDDYADYMPIVTALSKEYEVEEIAAAALKLMQEGNKALEIHEEKNTISDLTNTGGRPGMVRFFLNIGRNQKVTVPDLVRAISKEAEIPARSIGLVNIFDKFSFVEVPEQFAERVLAVMHKNSIRGYRVNIEPARARQ